MVHSLPFPSREANVPIVNQTWVPAAVPGAGNKRRLRPRSCPGFCPIAQPRGQCQQHPLLTQPGDSGAGPTPPPIPFSTAAFCLFAAETAILRGVQPGVRVSPCVPTLTSTPCLSLPPVGSGRCVKARCQRRAVPAELQGPAGSWEGQSGEGQDWSCAGPLTTPAVHRVRRPGPPTKPPAALRSSILSS